MTSVRAVLFGLAAAACGAAPPRSEPAPPAGDGAGLLQADADAPPGATTYERPAWQVGDRFTLVRGGVLAAEFEVVAADAGGYFVRGPGGVRLRRDLDLANLGEWHPDRDEPQHVLAPRDVRFHWPLWVGKRWSCEYVDRAAGQPALRTRASYLVEDLDTVTVEAGTFAALRIVRTLQLPDAGDRVLTRTQVIWYAPGPGLEVRQILGDSAVDLVAFARRGD
ncbi:MAG: hypothetical protein JNL08_05960 [Planctomycetes bacterium]|nr:hypothetical protein [Planctomycetota bacterium]